MVIFQHRQSTLAVAILAFILLLAAGFKSIQHDRTKLVLKQKDGIIRMLRDSVATLNTTIGELRSTISNLKTIIDDKNREIFMLKNDKEYTGRELNEKMEEIRRLKLEMRGEVDKAHTRIGELQIEKHALEEEKKELQIRHERALLAWKKAVAERDTSENQLKNYYLELEETKKVLDIVSKANPFIGHVKMTLDKNGQTKSSIQKGKSYTIQIEIGVSLDELPQIDLRDKMFKVTLSSHGRKTHEKEIYRGTLQSGVLNFETNFTADVENYGICIYLVTKERERPLANGYKSLIVDSKLKTSGK